MALFKRIRKKGEGSPPAGSSSARAASACAADLSRLGREVLAVRLESGAEVPAECTAVVIAESGQTRRVGAFGKPRLSLSSGELAWCFHPGPYVFALAPFAAAPETGLRLEFVIDAGDPRVQQQRFDLYLASEWCSACGPLSVPVFGGFVQTALQNALAQGMLDLAPCTSIEEWHAFRAGLNELLYTRFGVTVLDCYPIDLHPASDFAANLSARRRLSPPAAASPGPAAAAALPSTAATAAAAPSPGAAAAALPAAAGPAASPRAAGPAASPPTVAPAASPPRAAPAAVAASASAGVPAVATSGALPNSEAQYAQEGDARALRRLFLELPPLTSALRMITPPSAAFATQQELLQRLSLAALDVNTMPTFAWKAPDQPLPAAARAKRAAASAQAAAAMDAIWSLLARLKLEPSDEIPSLLDEADRLIANLEFALAARRATNSEEGKTGDGTPVQLQGDAVIRERREPTLGDKNK